MVSERGGGRGEGGEEGWWTGGVRVEDCGQMDSDPLYVYEE